MIDPLHIEKSCARIESNGNQGTGFFVSSDLVVTAYHVVMDSEVEQISIVGSDGARRCEIVAHDQQLDLCILRSEEKNGSSLPLLSSNARINEKCEISGYPYVHQSSYLQLNGKVVRKPIDRREDLELGELKIDGNYNYDGLSGAPIIVDGKVIGIATQQINDRILALSIYKARKFLGGNNITYNEELDYNEVPIEFKEELESSKPNRAVFESIDQALEENKNWYLLEGSPGSGKSIISASFIPSIEGAEVFARYFIKIPNDSRPRVLRTSKESLLEKVEDLIHLTLSGNPKPKSENSFEKRVEQLSHSIIELGEYFKSKSSKGIMIIDGLDEVGDLEEFLGIFPLQLPSSIKIMLSCTNKDILPIEIKNEIGKSEIIKVQPIGFGQCELFIESELKDKSLSIDIIQEIAKKSEGHPLYLRYLVEYIKGIEIAEEGKEIEEWLQEAPNIGGDIQKYYNSIWDELREIPDKLWIFVVLSQVRQTIRKQELFDMMPHQYQLSVNSYFESIEYLLNGSEKFEIYHDSFKYFINLKCKENIALANDLILDYCNSNLESDFSINNRLFHLALGSSPEKALEECNQTWADLSAVASVSPDLILFDIKKVISLAIDLDKITEVIRLLLLLQRIEFRYDHVFAENANQIARALIPLEKFSAALNYLVRDNTLLVSNREAISFLQLFYEYKANSEAEVLLNAINGQYRKLIGEVMRDKDGYSTEVFAFQLNAFTLSINSDHKNGESLFYGLQSHLKNLQDYFKENGQEANFNSIYRLREFASTWHMAYELRRFDAFVDAESTIQVLKNKELKIDKDWAKLRAMTVINFEDIDPYFSRRITNRKNFKNLIKDLEYLISNYGYNEEKLELELLILSLYKYSTEYHLVCDLMNKFLKNHESQGIRDSNGVDLNYLAVHSLFFEYSCLGYVDSKNDFPEIYDGSRYSKKWEDYVVSVIKCIGFIEGKLFSLKSKNELNDLPLVKERLYRIIGEMDFSLDERSSIWKRTYHLPESIFPIIYEKVFMLFTDFDFDRIEEVIEDITNQSRKQLGLYSEGYRNSLSSIIQVLIKKRHKKKALEMVIATLESHVTAGVQNRWERTQELLKIVEYYGLINSKNNAERVFNLMLDTSMGPSWYKEDQLDLINVALSLKLKKKNVNTYIKDFAGLLDYSSGEMTFQRYVRHAKESFLGNLARVFGVYKAIRYLKFETLPSADQVIKNAEFNPIDAPRVGDGYVLGARNINEASAVLELLENGKIESPFLAWALCDVFVINDDIFRYVQRFSKMQGMLLNSFELEYSDFLPSFHDRIVDTALHSSMSDDRNDYIRYIGKSTSRTNFEILEDLLKKKGFDISANKGESSEVSHSKSDTSNKSDLLINEVKDVKPESRKRKLQEALKLIDDDRVYLWYGNISRESDLLSRNLKKLFTSTSEVLNGLSPHIKKFGAESKEITSKLIWFIEEKVSEDEMLAIYESMSNHFKIILQPPNEALEKYKWIRNANNEGETSKAAICDFLIWLLNHPVNTVSERAFYNLQKLCVYESKFLVNRLIEHVIQNEPKNSTLQASKILREMEQTSERNVMDLLDDIDNKIVQLCAIEHFGIKNNLIEMSIKLNKIGKRELYEKLMNTIPDSIILTGEIIMDDSFLDAISYELDALNDLQILNGKFYEEMMRKINTFCEGLAIEDYLKSDRYIKRSFYIDHEYDGGFEALLKHALNIAIMPRVDKNNYNEVSEILS